MYPEVDFLPKVSLGFFDIFCPAQSESEKPISLTLPLHLLPSFTSSFFGFLFKYPITLRSCFNCNCVELLATLPARLQVKAKSGLVQYQTSSVIQVTVGTPGAHGQYISLPLLASPTQKYIRRYQRQVARIDILNRGHFMRNWEIVYSWERT